VQGFEPLGSTPDEFAQYIGREYVKWGAAAQAAGLKK
jgi:tripartite-type tricarboxylate transporter receptor subunit TctC